MKSKKGNGEEIKVIPNEKTGPYIPVYPEDEEAVKTELYKINQPYDHNPSAIKLNDKPGCGVFGLGKGTDIQKVQDALDAVP